MYIYIYFNLLYMHYSALKDIISSAFFFLIFLHGMTRFRCFTNYIPRTSSKHHFSLYNPSLEALSSLYSKSCVLSGKPLKYISLWIFLCATGLSPVKRKKKKKKKRTRKTALQSNSILSLLVYFDFCWIWFKIDRLTCHSLRSSLEIFF